MKVGMQPYKGARDFYPEEMRLRNYIFEKWKKVARLFGFEEYDFPILENFEIFASKSGEEIVNTQLFSFEDRSGRKLAIRPELTPSTVRMLAAQYNELIKPVKWFMIGNNWRYEKPQKGRGREFYQLEANIFGIKGIEADFEIINLIINLMKEFGATETMYTIRVSDRRLITGLLRNTLELDEEQQIATRRLMDKYNKMSREEFIIALGEINIDEKRAEKVCQFMECGGDIEKLSKVIPSEILLANEGFLNIRNLMSLLRAASLDKYVEFDPGIIRGFDYSDGLVYEAFDKNPEYKRSLFGGERFDKLIEVYGKYELEATGFAVSDVSLLEFLKGWNLVPELPQTVKALVVTFEGKLEVSREISQKLRDAGISTDLYLQSDKLDKQFKYADRKGIKYVVIPGEEEQKQGKLTLKDMKSREQDTLTLAEAIEVIGR